MIKHLRLLFLFSLCGIYLFGCTYHGTLKNDFHTIDQSKPKLPLKACLIYDSNVVDKSHYITNLWFWHKADISFQPELQKAMVNTFDSLFENLYVNSYIDQEKCKNADVIIFPTIEIRDNYLFYMSVLVKNYTTDEVLQKYESSGDISWSKPASATIVMIICTCSGMILSPILLPLEAQLCGDAVREALEIRVSSCLNSIAYDMRNDRSLVTRKKIIN
jgi:hypothetical protein